MENQSETLDACQSLCTFRFTDIGLADMSLGAGFRRKTVWLMYKMVEVSKMAEKTLDFNKSQDCMWSDATEEPF